MSDSRDGVEMVFSSHSFVLLKVKRGERERRIERGLYVTLSELKSR